MDVTIEGTTVTVSRHAADRYRERVHPAANRTAVAAQMAAVVTAAGTWSDAAPAWVSSAEAARADRWLMLGDDVALPCCGRSLTTVLVRGGMAPGVQRATQRRREQRRAQRRARRARQKRPRLRPIDGLA